MGELDWAVKLAKDLIKKYGQPVTLRNMVRGALPDPDKPHRPGPATTVDATVDAVFLDYEQKYIDGTIIQMGDQRVYMPSTATDRVTPVTPVVDAVILRGTEKPWKIISAKPLNPNGQQIMYDVQVRQ
ncbi:head closure [Stenotrophomonas phage vB_SmaS_Bhz59]